MFKFIKWLVVVFVLFVLLVIGLVFASFSSEQRVSVNSAKQVNQADSVGRLLKQFSDSVQERHIAHTITIHENQLNSIAGMAQRALPNLFINVDATEQRSVIEGSLFIKQSPIGQYVNFGVSILPNSHFDVEEVQIGALKLSGDLATKLVITIFDWWYETDVASQVVAQLRNVSMTNQAVTLEVGPLDGVITELDALKGGGEDDEALLIATQYYLQVLDGLAEGKQKASVSLNAFIQPLFSEVKAKSSGTDAAFENHAAIFALAIFAGHERFSTFVGDVKNARGYIPKPIRRPVIVQRHDLSLHFVFSAALELVSEARVGFAIGEFKELMDRNAKGSGYSFVDIAADMAGIQFATLATDSRYANTVQDVLSQSLSERSFFPSITGLPEGLSKQQFTIDYGEVDSKRYKKQMADVRRRLRNTPLYQATL